MTSVRSNGLDVPHGVAVSAAGQPLGIGVQLHKSGLLFTAKQNLSMWEHVGAQLFSFADSSSWWIADWLVYGESEFRDRYEEAIKRTSLSYQTLRNYTWVARAFPLPRRRKDLSFSHHFEVVALKPPEQDYWLRKAEELSWSKNKLRGEVRSSLHARQCGAERPDSESSAEVESTDPAASGDSPAPISAEASSMSDAQLLRLRLSSGDLAEFEEAAKKESQTVESWAAEVLRRAAAGS